MNRKQALQYVSYIVDDAGCGRGPGDDPHAIVRKGNGSSIDEITNTETVEGPYEYPSVLVGWQCGFEPLFVAVHSYLGVSLDDDEAEEMAREYLHEIGWFNGTPRDADYIIR